MDNQKTYPRIMHGQRATIAGRSGAGKSTLAKWLLNRSPGNWLIINPKWTAAYNSLESSKVIKGLDYKKIEKSLFENKFTIVNPLPDELDYQSLDNFISIIQESYNNIGLCVDELYMLHRNGQAGKGLLGWLTRGRELNQSFIGLTQRPSWISKFLFSEANYIGCMSLLLHNDRKTVYELTGQECVLNKLEPKKWFWFDADADSMRLFGPVPK